MNKCILSQTLALIGEEHTRQLEREAQAQGYETVVTLEYISQSGTPVYTLTITHKGKV